MEALIKNVEDLTRFLRSHHSENVKDLTRFLRSFHSELSLPAVLVAGLCGIFLAFVDFTDSVNNGRFTVSWSLYVSLLVCLIALFFNEIPAPSSNIKLMNWCLLLILVSFLYHYAVSTSHSVTTSPTMSLESKLYTFFLSTFASSILCLLAFHYILFKLGLQKKIQEFAAPNQKRNVPESEQQKNDVPESEQQKNDVPGTWVILQKIFPFEARKQPGIRVILHVSAIVSVACCVCLSRCRETSLEQRYWKEKFCSFWHIPVEFAYSDQHRYSPKLAGSESPVGSSDETYLRLTPWATFIGVYIVSFVVMLLKVRPGNQQEKPDFLAMSHWYSGTSLVLYKTVIDMLSTNVIHTRFDMRILQAALNQREEATSDDLYDHFSGKNELWFDFMADTGDGGNSTYTVARLLAQRKILVTDPEPSAEPNQDTKPELDLNRGNFLLIGGDLAYPTPSEFAYERRLFHPFQCAFQPPPNHDERMTTNKPVMPPGLPERDQDVPQCFVIPGNHDWFDGLCTFMRNICHRSWLGGWYMPQKKSYFALKLPKGWWIFGLDLAVSNDMDVYQFEFFSKLADEKVGQNDSVIIMTHQPDWLVDWYENGDSRNQVSGYQSKGKNVTDLIHNILNERCKLQIAGDIHHYMHHEEETQSNGNNNEPKHLLVNGCGGAFTHPTHTFHDFGKYRGVSYKKCKRPYPSFEESRRLAFGNIWNFSWQNWRFDFVGSIIQFVLVFSLLPRCELDQLVSASGNPSEIFGSIGNAFIYILEDSYVSLGSATVLLIVAAVLVPSKVSKCKRVMIGALHVFAHLAAALCNTFLLEVSIVGFVQSKTLHTSEYHSLYRSHQAMFHRDLPDPTSIQDTIKQWAFGPYQAYIKYFMSAFDVPELIAVSRSKICNNGIKSTSRRDITIYYASTFVFLYVFSAMIVSFIIGSYLCICINCLNLYYDEAFSSLRTADYKAFTRFHINGDGNLEVFTLAVDKVPREWELDPNWKEPKSNDLSHRRQNPSKWKAFEINLDPLVTVKIIDKFVIRGSLALSKIPPMRTQKETETTLKTEGKTNVDQTVAAKEIQEVEEKQSEAK